MELTQRRASLLMLRAVLPRVVIITALQLPAWLLDQAQKDTTAGKRVIPGVSITEDRKAV